MGRERLSKELKQFVPILMKNGYHKVRTKGSHFIYCNGENTIAVNKDLNRMVRKRLLKENNLMER